MIKLELKELNQKIEETGAKKILVQIPEGLKHKIIEIKNALETNGKEIVISMDPCWGACDIKDNEAKDMNLDLQVHIGHNQFMKNEKIKTIYYPLEYELNQKNIEKLIKKLIQQLQKEKIKTIELATTVQHINEIETIKKIIENKNIKVKINEGQRVQRGQVLGCNYTTIKGNEDAIVYFGDGVFHPIGIGLSTNKKIFIVNPITEEIKETEKEKEKYLRKRIIMIEKAKDAKIYGIVVSTKRGQMRISEAEKIKQKLETKNKKAIILSMDSVQPELFIGTGIEALIITACPRIAAEDYIRYKVPIINGYEVEYLIGEKKYEDYEVRKFY